jgi:hypothetical protein
VADRFHLLQNLAAVLTDVFRVHAPQLALVNAQHTSAPPPPSTRAAGLASSWRAQRVACHQQVWTYHRQGWTLDAIADQVGLSRRTVQRYLQSPTFPERQPRHDRDRSLLDPYKAVFLPVGTAGVAMGRISSARSAAQVFVASMALWPCMCGACARPKG